VPVEVEVVLRAGMAKHAALNGSALRTSEQLRTELATLVFTPDRLALVKGGPAVRRAYFDRAAARLLPARKDVPAAYGAALGQRNSALRRVALGVSSPAALEPWTAQVAELGAQLVALRREAIKLLMPAFAECAAAFGLSEAALVYEAAAPTAEALEARLGRDLDRGSTGLGPHLDEIGVLAGSRELRLYGSQGEQRLAVLALALAEAELLAEQRQDPPLLLLDDVLSELDAERRETLVRQLPARGQAVISATSRELLPVAPDQLLEVTPGEVRAA
jgi:DNA replication and repair protein RecF